MRDRLLKLNAIRGWLLNRLGNGHSRRRGVVRVGGTVCVHCGKLFSMTFTEAASVRAAEICSSRCQVDMTCLIVVECPLERSRECSS